MKWWPSPAEDRWLALAEHLGDSPQSDAFAAHTGGWRTARRLSRCVAFFLGIAGAAMVALVTHRLLPTDAATVVAGLCCVAIAEWLIIERHHFHSGIEEAFEVAGLGLLAYECWRQIGASELQAALLLGLAGLLAGLRLRTPLLAAGAVVALIWSIPVPPPMKAALSYAIGLAALAAGRLQFHRPSNDRMLDALVVSMPIAGYWCSISDHGLWSARDYWHLSLAAWWPPLTALLYAILALATGVRRRTHAPLLAGMVCLACTAYELRALSGLALEARLILWGSVLLVLSITLERALSAERRAPRPDFAPARRRAPSAGGSGDGGLGATGR